MEREEEAVWHSWWFLLAMYYVFFPVGIYYSYKKMIVEEKLYIMESIMAALLGFILLLCAGFIGQEHPGIALLMSGTILGFGLGSDCKKEEIRFQKEMQILEQGKEKISFSEIAEQLNYPVKMVKLDLEKKMEENKSLYGYSFSEDFLYKKNKVPKRKVFSKSYQKESEKPKVKTVQCKKCEIQKEKKRQVSHIYKVQKERQEYIKNEEKNKTEQLQVMITCPGCGAQNEVIQEKTIFCEYCGRRLK